MAGNRRDETPGQQGPRPIKALHHLPRGRNAWNPPFMKKWWFWPACIGGLVLLNMLASLVHRLLGA
ncbi:hypothetical protein [Desulfocurvus vexinensis]|uniref:hypothetical protein n=1 Tax=Desulfocurvus vexinensis TaxID=399548 RepID=UPI00048BE8D1|nr:hypothetical protein [Desulfocurvus vexinensis]